MQPWSAVPPCKAIGFWNPSSDLQLRNAAYSTRLITPLFFTVFKEVHPENADSFTFNTDSGIVTAVIPVQSLKASLLTPTTATPFIFSGIVISPFTSLLHCITVAEFSQTSYVRTPSVYASPNNSSG